MYTGPHSGKRTQKRQITQVLGFSLIELLIVVAILAVLAAVIAPQFSSSTTQAQESALRSNLSSLRSAIALYHRDHAATYPGVVASAGAACTTGATGGGAVTDPISFADQLTRYSNAAGETCTVRDPGFDFGPYLPTGIPANAITNVNTVALSGVGDLTMTADGTTGGWKFDYTAGKLIVNHTAYQTW